MGQVRYVGRRCLIVSIRPSCDSFAIWYRRLKDGAIAIGDLVIIKSNQAGLEHAAVTRK